MPAPNRGVLTGGAAFRLLAAAAPEAIAAAFAIVHPAAARAVVPVFPADDIRPGAFHG
ncbi:MAG: hypothetical protein K6G44_03360 [Lentisphaeria bacterium]|nr:hypothetical protein [Lentisphaeria bacterium]